MSAFTEPVTRKEGTSWGRPTHWYVDGNQQKIPGVTTILKDGLAKPALIGWGIRTVAEYAIDHWEDLGALPMSERLATLKKSPYVDRDAASNRGTEVHAIASELVQGHEVDVPDALAGHIDAYCKFLDEWQPQPVLVETTVYHLGFGWAGTLDLVADLPDGRRLLMDLKTSRSGVYGETAFQLAMYRWAEKYLDDAGEAQPMVDVDESVVVHVRADGYDVYPVPTGEDVLRQARHIAVVARAAEAAKGYVGESLPVPAEAVPA